MRGASLIGADLRQANLKGAEIDLDGLEPTAYAGAILPDGSTPVSSSASSPTIADSQSPQTLQGTWNLMTEGVTSTNHSNLSQVNEDEKYPGHLSRPLKQLSWQELPWLRLVAWGTGYGFLGLFLFCLTAEIWAWPLVWVSSLLWAWKPSLLRSQPLIAAVIAILTTGLSGAVLILGILLMGLATIGLRLTGWTWERAIGLSVWLSGAGCLTVVIMPLLLSRQQNLQVETVTSTPPLAIMLLLGITLSLLGLPAHTRLRALNLPQMGILTGLGIAAALGLALGGSMGLLAIGIA